MPPGKQVHGRGMPVRRQAAHGRRRPAPRRRPGYTLSVALPAHLRNTTTSRAKPAACSGVFWLPILLPGGTVVCRPALSPQLAVCMPSRCETGRRPEWLPVRCVRGPAVRPDACAAPVHPSICVMDSAERHLKLRQGPGQRPGSPCCAAAAEPHGMPHAAWHHVVAEHARQRACHVCRMPGQVCAFL